jgi:DNA-directed RNA polymerase subunit H
LFANPNLSVKFKGVVNILPYDSSLHGRDDNLSSKTKLEERKAKILMKLRGYKLLKSEELKNVINYTVKMKDKKKALFWVISTEGTVGVAYISQMKKAMDEAEVETGIIVTNGKYSPSAKVNAKKKGIELIPRTFPSFNIFDHEFVPKHEILMADEREKLLAKYRVQPYKMPEIRASDPAIIAIGAKSGDIVRVIRESPTAGKYVAYRYVVEG